MFIDKLVIRCILIAKLAICCIFIGKLAIRCIFIFFYFFFQRSKGSRDKQKKKLTNLLQLHIVPRVEDLGNR